jgi:Tol biopolymer transport system component
MRRCGAIPVLAFAALALAAPAHALYGPVAGGTGAEIVSVDNASDEQGNAATTDSVISADGRYVVFQTRATNFFEDDGVAGGDPEPAGLTREGGVFRYDRLTGQIQLVADGSEYHAEGPEKGKLAFRGAENPSVSADGRYVVFSSAQQLVPQAPAGRVEVYVRDMDVPLGSERSGSGAYRLVSAKSGGEEPANYAAGKAAQPGEEEGAEVWSHTAISADGRYVVFRTGELASDLPDRAAVDVGPRQLFVRDLQSDTTTLLSVEAGTGQPAGGAVGPASISADGSTVAWVGKNAPAQTRFLPGESLSVAEPYYLWRRWQEPGARTRRVTGVADPEDPECHEGEGITQSSQATGPCYGPLGEPESYFASIALSAPDLSADGYTVAFLAGAAMRPNITKSSGLDVFLTSMRPGVTRKAGTRELTLAVKSDNIGSTPSIETLALSPDGSTIAFSSLRDDFVLPQPAPTGSFRPFPTASELYVVNLAANTLERAVVGYSGADPTGSIAGSPSLTQDGSTVAFVSSANNLIYGDADGFPDAFTATLQQPGGTAPHAGGGDASTGEFSLEGEAPASAELVVHVRRGVDGGVLLLIEAPAAGRLTALARGRITELRRRGKASKANVLLASAVKDARTKGTVRLALHLKVRYAHLLGRGGRQAAHVTVHFTPASGGEALSQNRTVTFIRPRGRAKRP